MMMMMMMMMMMNDEWWRWRWCQKKEQQWPNENTLLDFKMYIKLHFISKRNSSQWSSHNHCQATSQLLLSPKLQLRFQTNPPRGPTMRITRHHQDLIWNIFRSSGNPNQQVTFICHEVRRFATHVWGGRSKSESYPIKNPWAYNNKTGMWKKSGCILSCW